MWRDAKVATARIGRQQERVDNFKGHVSSFRCAGKIMCEAQRLDLKAAREGRMTWRAYFEKWVLG